MGKLRLGKEDQGPVPPLISLLDDKESGQDGGDRTVGGTLEEVPIR